MSFDLEKLQAVAELGEVIRLQNEALERLQAFKKARPYMIMPNLAKVVEENMKESAQVLYKELNNLHRPAEQQTRYICEDCKMAFLVKLPGGICDECRARRGTKPRDYVVNAPPVDTNAPDDDVASTDEKASLDSENNTPVVPEEKVEVDPSDIRAETNDTSVIANAEGVPVGPEQSEEIADDAEHAASGDKLPIKEESAVTAAEPADASEAGSKSETDGNTAQEVDADADADDEMSEEFRKFFSGGNEAK